MTARRRESKLTLLRCAAGMLVAALALGSTVDARAQSRGLVGARAIAPAAAAPAAATPIPAKTVAPVATATSATVEQSGDTARLTFELSAPISAAAFALADPDRIIVDVPAVDFRLDPQTGKPAPHGRSAKPAGLVSSFRFGLLTPGKSRIVIDLGTPAKVVRVASEPGSDKVSARLVIELAKVDRATFRAAVRSMRLANVAEAAPGNPVAKDVAPHVLPTQKPVIMIDPGHGGVDSGAMVNGLIEKFLVFDFAKALAAKLEATGKFKIMLTRDEDIFIPLGQRVRMARDSNADLLVSVHADTLPDAADVTGATVYTVSDRASDAEAARVAEKENQSDAVAGMDGQEDSSGVSDILFDLTRRETRAFSHVFAHTLVNYWKVAGRLNKNPQRSAGFRVLMAPDVPSVLLELGYLSNDKDSAALNSPEWRDKASGQVAAAIEGFFAARGAGKPEAAAPDPTPTGTIPVSASASGQSHAAEDQAVSSDDSAMLRGSTSADVAGTSQPEDINGSGR